MATQVATARLAGTRPADDGRRIVLGIGGVFFALFLAGAALVGRSGAVAERITNPGVTGKPRPVEPLFGFDSWITLHQNGLLVLMAVLVIAFVMCWRRQPGHPIALMLLVTTLLI